MRNRAIVGLTLLAMFGLAACGGGDDPGSGGGPTISYTAGVFQDPDLFTARCQDPRSGIDDWTGRPWPDRRGSALHEKHYLRSWTNDLYLWFDEVIDRDPYATGGNTGGVPEYFDLLKTTNLTASGSAKDRFHFTYDTDEYRQLATAGIALGYGISWAIINPAPPREVLVEFVQAGTEAANGGVQRGSTLLRVDGVNVVTNATQAGVDAINAALFDPQEGSSHTFEFRDRGSSDTRMVTLTAAEIAADAVPTVDVIDHNGTSVGYLLFNDHTSAAEGALKSAVEFLAGQGIDELVLDLRYNGGGFLDIASELAYMIAGQAATAGRTFELLQFNSKHPTHHPLTGQLIQPVPFHSTTQDFSLPPGQPLPSLDLDRVYVLTSGSTCSASESIINSLRGIGIEVYQFGGVTCGKPYGFYAQDNCGTTYFSIQFRGVNDAGFGDYVDGFTPVDGIPFVPGANLPGCPVGDDLTRELGDPEEGQLRAALDHLDGNACPVMPKLSQKAQLAPLTPAEEALAVREPPPLPWRDNRILR